MATETDDTMFLRLLDSLNEAQKRWLLGREALRRGRGGIKEMCQLSGVSKPTVMKGIRELQLGTTLLEGGRIRQSGGGRKKIKETNPEIAESLRAILEETTAGDPMRLLKWTSKSTYKIRNYLIGLGYTISEDTVQRLLRDFDYSLQSNTRYLLYCDISGCSTSPNLF